MVVPDCGGGWRAVGCCAWEDDDAAADALWG